jgi:hypothetical protein
MLTQGSTTCLESQYKILVRFNGRIKNYDCCYKPKLMRFLYQNPNLTLLASYHKASRYQNAFVKSVKAKAGAEYNFSSKKTKANSFSSPRLNLTDFLTTSFKGQLLS